MFINNLKDRVNADDMLQAYYDKAKATILGRWEHVSPDELSDLLSELPYGMVSTKVNQLVQGQFWDFCDLGLMIRDMLLKKFRQDLFKEVTTLIQSDSRVLSDDDGIYINMLMNNDGYKLVSHEISI